MTEPKFPTVDRVEKRAYEFYLARGCADGYDVEDWLAAERELKLAEVSPKPKRVLSVPAHRSSTYG